MTQILVQADPVRVVRAARILLKQFPFAAMKALNRLAILFEDTQRAHQEKVFTLRQPTYFFQSVKIPKDGFATKERLVATVTIDPKTSKGSPEPKFDIFRRQEYGGTRRPVAGRKNIALPQPAVKRTSKDIIMRSDRPKRLKHEFKVKFRTGGEGLFVRLTSRHKGYTEVLRSRRAGHPAIRGLKEDPNVQFKYYLTPKTEIDAVYDWFQNARDVFRLNWERIFNEEMRKAFETIRFPGQAASQ